MKLFVAAISRFERTGFWVRVFFYHHLITKMKQGNSRWNRDRNAIRVAVACVILKNMRSNFQSAGKLRGEEELHQQATSFKCNKQKEEEEELRLKAHPSVERIMQKHLNLSLRVFSRKRQDQVMTLDSFQHALLCLNYACDSKSPDADLPPVKCLLLSCRRIFSTTQEEKWKESVLNFLRCRISSIMNQDCMTEEGEACIQRSVQSVIYMSSVSPETFDLEMFDIVLQRLSSLAEDKGAAPVREIENAWYLLDIARHFVLEDKNVTQLLKRSYHHKNPQQDSDDNVVPFSIVDRLIHLAEKHDKRGHSMMICMFLWQIVGVLSSSGSSINIYKI